MALGGIEILLQGGLHPDLGVEWYEDLFRWVKARWPVINLHALSPEEIWHIARTSELPLDDTIERLIAAGLDSIPGGGAEILDDEVRRRIAPLKCSTDEWLSVMKAAHLKGLRSTATMMFGVGEEPRHRVAHLLRLRELQDETRGFTAFICWPFQSANTRLTASDTSAHAYLRVNAVSRLVLDNVPNLQASWVTMGGGVAQAALHMGCNDFGSVMIEENVVSAGGDHVRDGLGGGRAAHPRRRLPAGAAEHEVRAGGTAARRARRQRPRASSPGEGACDRPGRADGAGRPGVATARGERSRDRDGAVALDGDVVVAAGPRAEIEARFGRGRAARRGDPPRARERAPPPRALAPARAGRPAARGSRRGSSSCSPRARSHAQGRARCRR